MSPLAPGTIASLIRAAMESDALAVVINLDTDKTAVRASGQRTLSRAKPGLGE